MNIGIERIVSFVPEGRRQNLPRCEGLGVTVDSLQSKIGFTETALSDDQDDAFSLAEKALEKLLPKDAEGRVRPGIVVVVTQTPGKPIPHLAARLHATFDLDSSCICFDISLGCSGYVYALEVVRALMLARGVEHGVVVTSDPYSKIVNPEDRATGLLFGDAASATLLSNQPIYRLGSVTLNTFGKGGGALQVKEGELFMDGREVFTFCSERVPDDIRDCLAKHQLTPADVPLFLLHQGSKYIVDTIARRLKVEPEKCPFWAGKIGNTVSSSIPLMLERVILEGANPEIVCLSGFGVGLSWATAVLTRANPG